MYKNLPKVIGLYSSRPGCGKTTVAMLLEELAGYQRMSFADTLKDMLKPLYRDLGFPDGLEELGKEDPIEEFFNLSPRYLMQTLGTEWGRSLHEDFWTQVMSLKLRHHFKHFPNTPVVIDDVRFDNEYKLVSTRGEMWMVTRPEYVYSAHRSEGNLDWMKFKQKISNSLDFNNLKNSLDSILREYSNAPF